jgi:hypothetical protein
MYRYQQQQIKREKFITVLTATKTESKKEKNLFVKLGTQKQLINFTVQVREW